MKRVDIDIEGKKIRKKVNKIINKFFKESFLTCSTPHIKSPKRKSSENVSFYYYYPFLFFDEFPDVSLEKYRILSMSGALYYEHCIWNDSLIDYEQKMSPIAIIFSNYLLKNSLNYINCLFDSSSLFWSYYEKYLNEFTYALSIEHLKHRNLIREYSKTEFELIAKGKSAMAKYITAALAILSSKIEKIELLEKAQDSFSIAVQLYDDFQDWRTDYKSHNYTYLLTKVILSQNLTEWIESKNPPDLETIGKKLYLSGTAEEQIKEILIFLDKAANYAPKCRYWLDIISKLRKICKGKLNNAIYISQKLLEKQRKNKGINNTNVLHENFDINTAFLKGKNFILTQQKLGFPELQSDNKFFYEEKFIASHKLSYLSSFQGILLIELLSDDLSLNSILNKIRKNIKILNNFEDNLKFNNFIYFDYLYKILIIFDNLEISKDNEIYNFFRQEFLKNFNNYCIYLKNTQNVSTNISISFLMKLYLIKGLSYFDKIPIENFLDEEIKSIEMKQNKSGYWEYDEYSNYFYITYLVIQLLTSIKPESSVLKKCEIFLLKSQNLDGGWGVIGSDPLNTAFSILGLFLLKSKETSTILKGIRYLISIQNDKGYWDKVEFLKIISGKSFLKIKSKTITTLFCLKALNLTLKNLIPLNNGYVKNEIHNTLPNIDIITLFKLYCSIQQKFNLENVLFNKIIINEYYNPNKHIFRKIYEKYMFKKRDFLNDLLNFDSKEILTLKSQSKNIEEFCKETLIKCNELLLLPKFPKIYLLFGPSNFLSMNSILDNENIIIISLSPWCSSRFHASKLGVHIKNRISNLKMGVAISLAQQYILSAIQIPGFLTDLTLDNLFKSGLAVFFSRLIFPDYELESHLFLTKNELEWCCKNEWYLKEVLKCILYKKNNKRIKSYFEIHSDNYSTLPVISFGSFVAFRIFEEYFKRNEFLNIRQILAQSPLEFIRKSRYFSGEY